jgi:hypothetical protein
MLVTSYISFCCLRHLGNRPAILIYVLTSKYSLFLMYLLSLLYPLPWELSRPPPPLPPPSYLSKWALSGSKLFLNSSRTCPPDLPLPYCLSSVNPISQSTLICLSSSLGHSFLLRLVQPLYRDLRLFSRKIPFLSQFALLYEAEPAWRFVLPVESHFEELDVAALAE